MMELSLSALIARYSNLSFPMICCCPTISSKVVGRRRDASGDSVSFFCSLIYSNKSMFQPVFLLRTFALFAFFILQSCILKFKKTFFCNNSCKYDRFAFQKFIHLLPYRNFSAFARRKIFSLFCMFFSENLSLYCAKAWTYF